MNDLKIYSAIYAVHENNEWRGYWSKIVAKSIVNAMNIIANKYGKVKFMRLEEIKLEEGMFL